MRLATRPRECRFPERRSRPLRRTQSLHHRPPIRMGVQTHTEPPSPERDPCLDPEERPPEIEAYPSDRLYPPARAPRKVACVTTGDSGGEERGHCTREPQSAGVRERWHRQGRGNRPADLDPRHPRPTQCAVGNAWQGMPPAEHEGAVAGQPLARRPDVHCRADTPVTQRHAAAPGGVESLPGRGTRAGLRRGAPSVTRRVAVGKPKPRDRRGADPQRRIRARLPRRGSHPRRACARRVQPVRAASSHPGRRRPPSWRAN